MANLIEVPFKGGSVVFAAAGSGGPEAYTGADLAKRAQDTFEDALDAVRAMGEAMSEKLKGLNFASAEASFGISFTGKGKFIVAEASGQASVTVKLTFNGK